MSQLKVCVKVAWKDEYAGDEVQSIFLRVVSEIFAEYV